VWQKNFFRETIIDDPGGSFLRFSPFFLAILSLKIWGILFVLVFFSTYARSVAEQRSAELGRGAIQVLKDWAEAPGAGAICHLYYTTFFQILNVKRNLSRKF
jgi:hypothetical protein